MAFMGLGGATAVIWTGFYLNSQKPSAKLFSSWTLFSPLKHQDFIQTIFLLIGGFYLMIKGKLQAGPMIPHLTGLLKLLAFRFSVCSSRRLWRVGWYVQLCYFERGRVQQHKLRPSAPGLFQLDQKPRQRLPWTGMSFGLAISSIWYFCSE